MNRYADDREYLRRGREPLDDDEIEQRMRDEEPLPVPEPRVRRHRDLDVIDDPTEGPPGYTETQRQRDEEYLIP